MRKTQEAYIVSSLRTPVGKFGGDFKHTRPDDLMAEVIKNLVNNNPSLPTDKIDDVIIGCAMPEAEQGMNVARMSLLLADLPNTVPGITINRFCCSGVQSIAMAAQRIWAGDGDVFLAGGTESMSMVPLGGYDYRPNPQFFENEAYLGMAYGMGITAEIVAEQYGITRDAQDNFALESHRRALDAIEKNYFKKEIIPIEITHNHPDLKNNKIYSHLKTIDTDQGPRAGSTPDMLAKLRSVFAMKGTVTAANSSQMSDGAGGVLIVSEQALKDYNLTPTAKFKSYAVAGVAPEVMGIGPVEAIPQALKKANLNLTDIDWIELNEAFAAQSLAVMKNLDLDPAKVNPQGGAIALGHPLGATGAIRTATLLHGLERINKKYGIVTMCIGTGMGACGVFERV